MKTHHFQWKMYNLSVESCMFGLSPLNNYPRSLIKPLHCLVFALKSLVSHPLIIHDKFESVLKKIKIKIKNQPTDPKFQLFHWRANKQYFFLGLMWEDAINLLCFLLSPLLFSGAVVYVDQHFIHHCPWLFKECVCSHVVSLLYLIFETLILSK